MPSTVQKRDNRLVPFDSSFITRAICLAGEKTGELGEIQALSVTSEVLKALDRKVADIVTVEEIQDLVEHALMDCGFKETAKEYIIYRNTRTRIREGKSDLMEEIEGILEETHRENANISNSPSAKMLQIASAASKKYYLTNVIPDVFSKMHRNGDIHIHDLDFFGKTLTCCQIPLGRLLSSGFDNGHGFIRPPQRAGSAAALAAIILQSCQNDMHGGQSFAFFDRDMAPFAVGASDREVYQAMEALIFNLNSMHSRAGAQVPFSSLNVGGDTSLHARRVTYALLKAYEAGLGHGENPIFPNVIFRLKKGINMESSDPNYDLFKLAIRVASKRLNPTFTFMDAEFNTPFGMEVATMGCRTRVIANRHGDAVTDGRGNLSFTTINLPRLAIRAKGDVDRFWKLLEETSQIAIDQLYHRFTIQAALKVKDMPFLMGQGVWLDSDKLEWNEPIEAAIKHGTLSMGFIGLAETLTMLTGRHQAESVTSQRLGESIVAFLRMQIDQACEDYDLNYTLLATPAEGLSGRFVTMDRQRFGIIQGVTDKDYYTNSYHVPVGYELPMAQKVEIEGPYHKYCNAGHISYVEMGSPPEHNHEAVEDLLHHMLDCGMGYGGINYPIDFCKKCNYMGIFAPKCPRCGGTDIRMVRRITGYLSVVSQFNDAKRQELKDRRPHF